MNKKQPGVRILSLYSKTNYSSGSRCVLNILCFLSKSVNKEFIKILIFTSKAGTTTITIEQALRCYFFLLWLSCYFWFPQFFLYCTYVNFRNSNFLLHERQITKIWFNSSLIKQIQPLGKKQWYIYDNCLFQK